MNFGWVKKDPQLFCRNFLEVRIKALHSKLELQYYLTIPKLAKTKRLENSVFRRALVRISISLNMVQR